VTIFRRAGNCCPVLVFVWRTFLRQGSATSILIARFAAQRRFLQQAEERRGKGKIRTGSAALADRIFVFVFPGKGHSLRRPGCGRFTSALQTGNRGRGRPVGRAGVGVWMAFAACFAGRRALAGADGFRIYRHELQCRQPSANPMPSDWHEIVRVRDAGKGNNLRAYACELWLNSFSTGNHRPKTCLSRIRSRKTSRCFSNGLP